MHQEARGGWKLTKKSIIESKTKGSMPKMRADRCPIIYLTTLSKISPIDILLIPTSMKNSMSGGTASPAMIGSKKQKDLGSLILLSTIIAIRRRPTLGITGALYFSQTRDELTARPVDAQTV